jgi:serine/threonine protein kinase
MNSRTVAEDLYDTWEPLFTDLYQQTEKDSPPSNSWDNKTQLAALFEHFHVPSDRYKIGEILGKGGWKEVRKAFDKHTGREVAFAQPSDTHSSDTVEAFLREARIIARLQHPNIIALYSLGISEEGVPFYAMETQLGGSFRKALKTGQLSADQALEIYLQVCHAIAYAHLVGIVHLDLKPENIQIGAHGAVKVCDWGLSATIRASTDETEVATGFYDLCGDNGDFSLTAGTPGYLAPERKTHRTPAAPTADIFALGVILKEITSLFPRSRRRRLAAIAAKASAESPESRYSSVVDLQDDLKHFQTQFPTSVEPGGILSRLRLFVRRHQLSITYTAASCALIAVLSALAFAHNERTQKQINRAVSAEEKAHELQLLAETEAQDTQTKLVQEAYDQSRVLLDLVTMSPSLSQEFVSESITILTEAVDSSTNNETTQLARTQLGTSYFVAQRFNKAVEAYSGTGRNEDLKEIAARFADSPRKNGVLTAPQFIELLQAIPPKRILLQQQMVFYDRSLRKEWEEQVQITLTWLENKNPSWSAEWSKWSLAGRSLHLKGKGLNTLTENPATFSNYNRNILQGLDLQILRLDKTGFRAFGQLTRLHLATLDVSRETNPNLKTLELIPAEVELILPPPTHRH